jgi:hypothetical protein
MLEHTVAERGSLIISYEYKTRLQLAARLQACMCLRMRCNIMFVPCPNTQPCPKYSWRYRISTEASKRERFLGSRDPRRPMGP